jgi:hypothetical protein
MKGTRHKAITYKAMTLICVTILFCAFAPSALAETDGSPVSPTIQEDFPSQDSPSEGSDSRNGTNDIGPQIATCGDPGTHTGYGPYGGSLVWNEHVDGEDCVLELISGTIPNHGTGPYDWMNAPWYQNSDSITKLVVDDNPDDPVTLDTNSSYGLFCRMYNLRSADVRNLDTHNATSLLWMFTGCVKLTQLDVTPRDNK